MQSSYPDITITAPSTHGENSLHFSRAPYRTEAPHREDSKPDEDSIEFWKRYNALAEQHDSHTLDKLVTSMDILLIFSGLFSAIDTAFIAVTLDLLSQSPAQETNVLLRVLISQTTSNTTFLGPVATQTSEFNPSTSDILSNCLFISSLMCSVFAAFGAVLGKQWISQAERPIAKRSAKSEALERQRRFTASEVWRFEDTLELLPILLQVSLTSFWVALVLYLWNQSLPVACVAIAFATAGSVFYLYTLIAAVQNPHCPFQTPLSKQLIRASSTKPLKVLRERITRIVHGPQHFLPKVTPQDLRRKDQDIAFSHALDSDSVELECSRWILLNAADTDEVMTDAVHRILRSSNPHAVQRLLLPQISFERLTIRFCSRLTHLRNSIITYRPETPGARVEAEKYSIVYSRAICHTLLACDTMVDIKSLLGECISELSRLRDACWRNDILFVELEAFHHSLRVLSIRQYTLNNPTASGVEEEYIRSLISLILSSGVDISLPYIYLTTCLPRDTPFLLSKASSSGRLLSHLLELPEEDAVQSINTVAWYLCTSNATITEYRGSKLPQFTWKHRWILYTSKQVYFLAFKRACIILQCLIFEQPGHSAALQILLSLVEKAESVIREGDVASPNDARDIFRTLRAGLFAVLRACSTGVAEDQIAYRNAIKMLARLPGLVYHVRVTHNNDLWATQEGELLSANHVWPLLARSGLDINRDRDIYEAFSDLMQLASGGDYDKKKLLCDHPELVALLIEALGHPNSRMRTLSLTVFSSSVLTFFGGTEDNDTYASILRGMLFKSGFVERLLQCAILGVDQHFTHLFNNIAQGMLADPVWRDTTLDTFFLNVIKLSPDNVRSSPSASRLVSISLTLWEISSKDRRDLADDVLLTETPDLLTRLILLATALTRKLRLQPHTTIPKGLSAFVAMLQQERNDRGDCQDLFYLYASLEEATKERIATCWIRRAPNANASMRLISYHPMDTRTIPEIPNNPHSTQHEDVRAQAREDAFKPFESRRLTASPRPLQIRWTGPLPIDETLDEVERVSMGQGEGEVK